MRKVANLIPYLLVLGMMVVGVGPAMAAEPVEHALVPTKDGGFLWLTVEGAVVLTREAIGTRRIGMSAQRLAADPQGHLYIDDAAFEVGAGGLLPLPGVKVPQVPVGERQSPHNWYGYLARGPDGSKSSGDYRAFAVDQQGRMLLGGPGIHRLSASYDAEQLSTDVVLGLLAGSDGGLHVVRDKGPTTQLLYIDNQGRTEVIASIIKERSLSRLSLVGGLLMVFGLLGSGYFLLRGASAKQG